MISYSPGVPVGGAGVSQFGDGHAEKQNGSQGGEVCAPVVGEQCQDTADEESAY